MDIPLPALLLIAVVLGTLGGLAAHLGAGSPEPEPPQVPEQDRSKTISKRRAMRDRRRMRAG